MCEICDANMGKRLSLPPRMFSAWHRVWPRELPLWFRTTRYLNRLENYALMQGVCYGETFPLFPEEEL